MRALLNDEINRTKRKGQGFYATLLVIIACLLTGKLLSLHLPNLYIFNYSPYLITSASMEKEYPIYSIVVIKKTPFSKLKVGDVIAFKSSALNGRLAMHRINRASEQGFYTKGDNNHHEDNQLITEATYAGKAVAHFSLLSGYIQAIKRPWGLFLFFILPLSALGIIYCSFKELRRLDNYEKKN